jgi:hypothetical protein
MRHVPDWAIQVCWWISGIFATGAVWYFLSLKDVPWAIASAIAAAFFALVAIGLHRRKDAATRLDSEMKNGGIPFALSLAPTRENIERVILESRPHDDWNRHTDLAKTVYSYKGDVNLRFEMVADDSGIQCADFREPWANNFPDPSATGYWCDLFYGSTHVARYILVAVDGARALLPIPKRGLSGKRPNEVTPFEHQVARIHDTLGTLDEYMRGAGLSVHAPP